MRNAIVVYAETACAYATESVGRRIEKIHSAEHQNNNHYGCKNRIHFI